MGTETYRHGQTQTLRSTKTFHYRDVSHFGDTPNYWGGNQRSQGKCSAGKKLSMCADTNAVTVAEGKPEVERYKHSDIGRHWRLGGTAVAQLGHRLALFV